MANNEKNVNGNNVNGNNGGETDNKKESWFTAHKTGVMAVLATIGNVLLEVLVGILTIVGAGLVIGKVSGIGRSGKYIKYSPKTETRPDVPTHVPETPHNN